MLEEIAIQYVSQPEIHLQFIPYLITIVGAIVAAISNKSAVALRRSPYFAYSAILFFLAAVAQLVWLNSNSAILGGFLWVLMITDVIVRLAAGYTLGIIAMARSRDAYGHARRAFLAFIPIANLWLLLTHSRDDVSAVRASTMPLLTGRLGVLTGCALFIAGTALGSFVRIETTRMAAEAENDPAMQRTAVDMMLRSRGMEKTLQQIAAEVLPQRVDETTKLLWVEGNGTTLRFGYEVSTNLDTLLVSLRPDIVQNNCALEGLRPLIEAGATIEHAFYRTDGGQIGVVSVTRDICGF